MGLASDQIRAALEATGLRLGEGPEIEVLVVGGAAAILNGLLRPERTTADVDVLNVVPSREDEALYEAAALVGREMGLPNDWLNGDAGLYREALLPTWKDRRIQVGHFGRLTVYTASRIELIAMKFYAGRAQDIEDLLDLSPTPEERRFVRAHIAQIGDDGRVLRTLERIDEWEH
jgi:uncharacterized nucleotidyltransferase DUF6036